MTDELKSTGSVTDSWPADVREVLGSLEGMFPPMMERRKVARDRYYAQATLVVEPSAPTPTRTPTTQFVYIRDINIWAAGYITNQRLSAYGHATVSLVAPDGTLTTTRCMIRRCREFAPGWFDGVLEFDNAVERFSRDNVRKLAA